MLHHIYALIDPRKPDVFEYIGQTRYTPEFRLRNHVSLTKKHTREKKQLTYKEKWINKLLREGVRPFSVVIEIVETEIVDEREIFWIAHHRIKNKKLKNFRDGGGWVPSDIQKEARAEINRSKGKMTIDERKAYYLSLPADTPNRPSKKENFSNFLNKNCIQYDEDFTKRIKERFPHWFIENRVAENKKILLSLPLDTKRPSNKRHNKLGIALSTYTSKNCESYDEDFTLKIKERFPNWFIDIIANNAIETLLAIPPGEPFPPELKTKLRGYTLKNGVSYRPDFDVIIREKQPFWFKKGPKKKVTN